MCSKGDNGGNPGVEGRLTIETILLVQVLHNYINVLESDPRFFYGDSGSISILYQSNKIYLINLYLTNNIYLF